MTRTISVGELRRGLTRVIREVRAGAAYTITDHGEPVAEIARALRPHWVSGDEVDALLRQLGPDHAWARETTAARRAVDPRPLPTSG